MTRTIDTAGTLPPEIRKLITEYRTTFGGPIERHRNENERALARLAYRVACLLGHNPMRQGESVECSLCGASGYAREVLGGAVHLNRCENGVRS